MKKEEIQEIQRLHRQGMDKRAIARRMNRNIKSIRRALRDVESPVKTPPPKTSKLEPFHEQIRRRVQKELTAPRILREIQELGYAGGRTILAEYVRKLRGPKKKSRKVFARFETGKGKEAQIDWSPFRVPIARKPTTIHCFSMILAHSRMLYVAFFRDERLPTLLSAHVEAFTYFQGCCERLVYDNMATVTYGRRGRAPLWNPTFLEFAKHYGFEPFACDVADPNRKGKVERPFTYIESDFLRGETFESWEDLNRRCRRWLDVVANARKHETTKRKPMEMHEEEKPLLLELPRTSYPTAHEEVRKVGRDGYVSVGASFYPVPARLVGQYVPVRIHPHRIEILDGKRKVVAAHAIPATPCRLPAPYEPRERTEASVSRTRMESEFLALFPRALPFLEGLQDRMKGLLPVHLRQIRHLANLYGRERVDAAIERALKYRNFNAATLKRILEEAHPEIFDEPPVKSVSADPSVMGVLDDIDSGSLDSETYSFDTRPSYPGEPDEKSDSPSGA